MTLPRHSLVALVTVMTLARYCEAGLQVMLPIINMVNVPVTIDMDLRSNCLQDPSDYSTDDLTSYYAAYRTTSLTDSLGSDFNTYQDYLDYCKKVTQIGDIGSALANMDGQHTLDAWRREEKVRREEIYP